MVSLVLSLEEHVRRLFLAVLTDLGSACGSADRPSDSDVITLLAFVSVVVNAAYGELRPAEADCLTAGSLDCFAVFLHPFPLRLPTCPNLVHPTPPSSHPAAGDCADTCHLPARRGQ